MIKFNTKIDIFFDNHVTFSSVSAIIIIRQRPIAMPVAKRLICNMWQINRFDLEYISIE